MPDHLSIRAAWLGFLCGLRSIVPFAVVTWAANDGRLELPNEGPFSLPAQRWVMLCALAGAAAEVVGDKTPLFPDRTMAIALVPRMVSGGIVGGTVYASRRRPSLPGTLLGSVAAVMGAYAGRGYRASTLKAGIPNVLTGAVEDAFVVWAMHAGLRRR